MGAFFGGAGGVDFIEMEEPPPSHRSFPTPVLQQLAEQQLEINESQFQSFEKEASTLSEVEARLVKANYYRAILDQSLFGEDGDVTAQEVQAEFRDFAITKLRQLMGIEPQQPAAAPVAAQFSDDEVRVLKALADRMAAKLPMLQNKPQVVERKEPTVQPVTLRPKKQTPAPKRQVPQVQEEPVRAPTAQVTSFNTKPVPYPDENQVANLAAQTVSFQENSKRRDRNLIDTIMTQIK